MVKRTAPFGVVCLVLLAAGVAVCQDARRSLPDAPLVQLPTQAWGFHGMVSEEHFALQFSSAGVMRPGEYAFGYKGVSGQKDPEAVFRKYLYPSSPRQASSHSGNGGSLMGRATYAASRTLIARNDSGKARLNTSYLLRTLTSVAKDTASSPYWRRSLGAPFGDFGATVGNDAGMNLWHEFGPSLGQFMKSHTPAFVSKMAERIGHK